MKIIFLNGLVLIYIFILIKSIVSLELIKYLLEFKFNFCFLSICNRISVYFYNIFCVYVSEISFIFKYF